MRIFYYVAPEMGRLQTDLIQFDVIARLRKKIVPSSVLPALVDVAATYEARDWDEVRHVLCSRKSYDAFVVGWNGKLEGSHDGLHDAILAAGQTPVIALIHKPEADTQERLANAGIVFQVDMAASPSTLTTLLARIDARGRSARREVTLGPLRLDFSGERVYANDELVELSNLQRAALFTLARYGRNGRYISKTALADMIYGDEPWSDAGIETVVSMLRLRLNKAHDGLGGLVQSKRNLGYRLAPVDGPQNGVGMISDITDANTEAERPQWQLGHSNAAWIPR